MGVKNNLKKNSRVRQPCTVISFNAYGILNYCANACSWSHPTLWIRFG